MVPLEFLQDSKNKLVCVHTTDKRTYTGKLTDFDTYVNIIIADARMKDDQSENTYDLGNTIIQGNTVTFIEVV